MIVRVVAIALATSAVLGGCARAARLDAPAVVVVGGVSSGAVTPVSGEWAEGGGSWNTKDEVEVEWHGSWWPAVVLEKRGRDRWLVHYEGYGDDWDEVVRSDRIRERRAEPTEDPEEDDVDP